MAIKPETEFVGKINAADGAYPQGSARDITAPGDGTGTPFKARLVNDFWGFLQKLLTIGGITPSGSPDTVLASDYFDGLMTVVTRPTLTTATLTAIVGVKAGQVFNVAERSNGNGGGAIWFAIVTGVVPNVDLPNTSNIIIGVADPLISFVLRVGDKADLKQFGGIGDDTTDATTLTALWLDYVIANNIEGVANDGTFLINYISKAANSGITLSGNGIFKATGANRLNMMRFTAVRGQVNIDGLTWDGNDIVARPFTLENDNSTPTLQGDIYIGAKARFINAKNNSPDTFVASACFLRGGFTKIIFEGEVDGVDSTSTSGAVAEGLVISHFTTTVTDYVKSTTITGAARFKNIKNDNTVLADADGLKIDAPTSVVASLTVQPGAYFENCKGRSIKSQVQKNAIDSPVIFRDAYDGLSEINLQYAGGYVRGANILYDGTRVSTVIQITQRATPDNTQCSISENELTVIGAPSSDTGFMVATDVTDAAVKVQGINIRDNKVKGTVDKFVGVRVANVVDVNRVVIDGNWAETVTTAFIGQSLFGANRAQLTVVFTNNGCENGCTGLDLVAQGDLIIERAANNQNITPLLTKPFVHTIAAGVLTPNSNVEMIGVNVESGTSDTVNTINMTNYNIGETLTIVNNNASHTITYADGVGNLKLPANAVLTSLNDTLVVRKNENGVVQVSLSINGA